MGRAKRRTNVQARSSHSIYRQTERIAYLEQQRILKKVIRQTLIILLAMMIGGGFSWRFIKDIKSVPVLNTIRFFAGGSLAFCVLIFTAGIKNVVHFEKFKEMWNHFMTKVALWIMILVFVFIMPIFVTAYWRIEDLKDDDAMEEVEVVKIEQIQLIRTDKKFLWENDPFVEDLSE